MMIIKEGFILREIMGKKIVVASGEASKIFSGMIKLNETAALIWEMVAAGKTTDEIADKLVYDYKIDKESAVRDIDNLAKQMIDNNIWEQ